MKTTRTPEPPVIDLVAGPQGSGKSTFFPVAERGHDSFNIDDHRKALNAGSAQNIPTSIQETAQADYENFVESRIRNKISFSIEVTLASETTFIQAEKAREADFVIHLTYISAALEDCIERVANRVDLGGHGVREDVLKSTYAASMKNIPRAIQEFDVVQIYDNSRQARIDVDSEEYIPRLVLESQGGTITFKAPDPPRWLKVAIRKSKRSK